MPLIASLVRRLIAKLEVHGHCWLFTTLNGGDYSITTYITSRDRIGYGYRIFITSNSTVLK